MPTTEQPGYTDVISTPLWSYGHETDGPMGLRRVTTQDMIKTADINQLRSYVELMWNHTHEYVDVVGGGGGGGC